MLHSRATAALMRLKEMDKKYNIKRNEGTRIQSNVSTESSLENSPRSSQVKSEVLNGKQDRSVLPITAEKEIRPKISPKFRMEVKIPFIDAKNDESSSINDSTTSKKSPKTSPKIRSITENDVSIEMQEKSERSRSKEFPKSLSNLETNSRYKAKIPMIGSGDSPRSNDYFSVATVFSRRSDDSEIISEAIKSVNETSFRKSSERSNEPEVIAAEDSVLLSNYAESTIEEVIKTSEEKSEIVTEQTNTINKDISMREVSLKEEQKATYEDDTFEEASSSIESSSSVDEKLKNNLEEDTVISGVKQIKITPHKQTEIVQRMVIDEDKDKEIVELIAPKIMQSTSECDIGLDEELSNYVKTTENVDEAVPINLLKLSKQVTSTKKHVRRKKYRKLSNENTEERTDSSVASEHERLTERKENSVESFTSTKSVKNGKETQKETCLPIRHHKEKYINKIADGKLKTEIEDGSPETDLSEDKFLRETPKQSDVTSTLRKLNKDAINAIVRRDRVQAFVETPDKFRPCKNCGTIMKLPSVDGANNAVDYDGDDSSLENFKVGKNPSHDQRIKQKKVKYKKVSKSSKSRKSNCGKIDGKHSRFDCRQTHRLRKQAVTIRLQQEREDIRNYLMELEHTRLKFTPGTMFSQLPAFKPLEFPKIAAFTKPEESSKFKAKDEIAELQERIVTIRQWLKDQYILYRDYSSLAQTVNSKYIPSSLEDAKRTIRQLQRATIKNR
ncbi:hepatoma-derived growth factor-related protein 2-like [Frieseomelitta varia]|uniref:hepatoma-derived growth factor-related protein 2-like n=1 Tax=Frieseomelitta varia TaxID=561572 RepID=UPI001CB67DCB|nr:hepatoma-derived growth factor-related protein 2-like [Frieseomelitta varia]